MLRVPVQPIVRNIPEFWEGRAPPHGTEPGPSMFGVLLTLEWLTYYAIASDLIVLPGQGGLVIVTVQVPRSPRNEEKCHYLEEKRCVMFLLLPRIFRVICSGKKN